MSRLFTNMATATLVTLSGIGVGTGVSPAIATVQLEAVNQTVPQTNWGKCAAGITAGAVSSAATIGIAGTAIGTVTLPVVGTIGGGALGATIGAIGGGLTGAAATCFD